MIDKNLIGYSFEPVQLAVEAGRLRFVAKALGLTDPVYIDVDAARAEGYSDLLAPPTFPFMLESDALELAELCDFSGRTSSTCCMPNKSFLTISQSVQAIRLHSPKPSGIFSIRKMDNWSSLFQITR